jgi:inner membrane protein
MDNLCHTLVGAALAQAGLKKKTALATATLVIGANLPDVDVLAYAWGSDTALGFRRGWTHGLLALALWPFVLTGIMLAWDRLVRRRRHPETAPASPGALLLLATVSILTHPFLDWLNTYGMRWLMPFRDIWSYGDVLFIIDPWIWLALGSGWWWSRRRSKRGKPWAERPARTSLALVCVYILVLWGVKLASAQIAREEIAREELGNGRLMAGPLPLTPVRRQIVAESRTGYALGTVDWLGQRYIPGTLPFVEKNEDPRIVEAVESTYEGRIFLHWARFPFYQVEEGRDGRMRITVLDARYALQPGRGIGSLVLEVPVPPDRP